MDSQLLQQAIATVPPGAWAVGVSGGADSVSLLLLLRLRPDLQLRIAHLDHETRNGESGEDARFAAGLAEKLSLPISLARRSEIESSLTTLPANRSARFRAGRFAFFKQVVAEHALQGVVLAHHRADQAETILLRLIRGSGALALTGIRPRARVAGVTVLRPLLNIPPGWLREFLAGQKQDWREDASNRSPAYLRNRLRPMLENLPALQSSLLDLAIANQTVQEWIDHAAPALPGVFRVADLAGWPTVLARAAARRWLLDQGITVEDLGAADVDRLIYMVEDAASPARYDFPGGITVRRRAKVIFVDRK